MFLDTLLGFLAIQALGRKQPPDVGRVAGVNFPYVSSTMSTKGQDELIAILSNFPHRIHGLQILQSPPQFRGIVCSIAVDNPSLKLC